MSGIFEPRQHRHLRVVAILLSAAAMIGAIPAHADTFAIRVDQARIMKLPEKATTIVIGNPLIADAALQSGGILVITGKGYGSTNMLALDRAGQVIMNETVQVLSPEAADLVTVYKGVARESYSCAPECGPRITLGDDKNYFAEATGQSAARMGGGQASAAPSAPH
jgi:hypothetical protein